MSTVATMAPSPAPHERASYNSIEISSQHSSPPTRPSTVATAQLATRRESDSPKASTEGKKGSPNGSRSSNNAAPKIIVKKEPLSSPEIPASSRHRPRKLDLSKHTSITNPSTARPSAGQLTSSRESGGLGIQDVGIACLSPGFITQDPTMRNQLARSISVREQQRHIIESRLQQTAKPENAPQETPKHTDALGGPSHFGGKTPGTSRRKAPPGLSIIAPSHEQFANERVIQSAPLNHSFTGRHQPQPLTRHIANQPSNLSNTSHIHHVPATQTSNRLPPISDVFGVNEGLGIHHRSQNTERDDRGVNGPRTANFFPSNGNGSSRDRNNSDNNSSHSNQRPTFPSPGRRSEQAPPHSARHRSAEEAQAELAGGRPELLPKLVHYGGHQPPTPPSPPNMRGGERSGEFRRDDGFPLRSAGGLGSRRRTRAEYEDGESPPLGNGPSAHRRAGPFGEGRDSPEAQARKKAEFIGLCARAWDLFHT